MPNIQYQDLKPPHRILLGPGPSNLHPRVQKAMTEFLVSHLDPYIFIVMDDIMKLLRFVFRTKNELTFPISGSGSAGMETGFCNFLEPGEVAVIGINGYFGERMVENATLLEQRINQSKIAMAWHSQSGDKWSDLIESMEIESKGRLTLARLYGAVVECWVNFNVMGMMGPYEPLLIHE